MNPNMILPPIDEKNRKRKETDGEQISKNQKRAMGSRAFIYSIIEISLVSDQGDYSKKSIYRIKREEPKFNLPA